MTDKKENQKKKIMEEKEMKETKDKRIEFRLTAEEKEKILAYAEKHNLTMSEVVRELCQKIFNQED